MTLHAWQSALAEVLIARSSRADPTASVLTDPRLTPAERGWLDSLSADPGFEVTCDVQRWWRHFRVQSAAPLTLAALGPELRRPVLDEFVESCARPSSFFMREALRFLDYVISCGLAVPHLEPVAAFERAMLRLSESIVLNPPDPTLSTLPLLVRRNPMADMVAFAAAPEQVLAALVGNTPPPPEENREHWLLVAPGLTNLARPASPLEASVFNAVTEPTRFDDGDDALLSLWRAGALTSAA
jgi:hypothetical protein